MIEKFMTRVSTLRRGEATRNSTGGNVKHQGKRQVAKLSRTASDARRGPETEIPTRMQPRKQHALLPVRPFITRKHHREEQQSSSSMRPLTDLMSKTQGDKEVPIWPIKPIFSFFYEKLFLLN